MIMDIQNLIAEGVNVQFVVKVDELKELCSYFVKQEFERLNNLKEQENDGLLGTKEVMKLLHVSEATLGRWKRNGYLRPERKGGRNGYHREDVYEILGKRNLEVD